MDSGGSRSLMSPGETGNLLLLGSIYILRASREILILYVYLLNYLTLSQNKFGDIWSNLTAY